MPFPAVPVPVPVPVPRPVRGPRPGAGRPLLAPPRGPDGAGPAPPRPPPRCRSRGRGRGSGTPPVCEERCWVGYSVGGEEMLPLWLFLVAGGAAGWEWFPQEEGSVVTKVRLAGLFLNK